MQEIKPTGQESVQVQSNEPVTAPTEEVKPQFNAKPQKAAKANAGDGAKMELLKWVQGKLLDYKDEFKVKDFTKSWQDGKALSALISTLKPKALKYKDINFVEKSPLEINTDAIRIAEEELDIPEIIDPEDITETPEELSVMTYISYFRDYDMLHPYVEEEEPVVVEEPIVEEPVVVEEPIVEEPPKPEIDPSKCIAEGPALDKANPPRPGTETSFTIITYDADGNKIPTSSDDDQVMVTLFSPHLSDEESSLIPEPTITNKADGTFDVSFVVPVGVKDLKALIFINGESIEGSPHDIPNASVFDAVKTEITGPGVEPYGLFVDETTNFTIQTRDEDGNNLPVGGMEFNIELKDSNGNVVPIPVDIKDNSDGSYNVSYTPFSKGGKYELSILTKDGAPVGNSPFDVIFQQKVEPSKCTARGNGVLPFGLKSGVNAQFEVEVRDKNGEIIPYSEDEITVDITYSDGDVTEAINPEDYNFTIENNQDGTHTVKYKPTRAGTHYVTVKCNDSNIGQSPFKVQIENLPKAPSSKLKLVSIKSLPNLVETELDLKALDQFGKKAPFKNCKLTAMVEDENGNIIPADLINIGDDKYKVVFQPNRKPGSKYTTKILMDGVPIAGESVKMEYKPLISGKNCKVYGPGLNGADLQSKDSVPCVFKIKSYNNANEPFIQENLKPLKASGKKLKRLAKTIFKEPEHFAELFKPGLEFDLENEHVDSIDLTKTVDLDEIHPQLEKHVKAVPFTVVVQNEETKEQVPCMVFNTAPGEYTALYQPSSVGPHSIDIRDKPTQSPIANSPYKCYVVNGVDPALCQVKGPGLYKTYKGKPTYVTILPRDANNFPATIGGQDFYVSICDVNKVAVPAPLAVVDNGNGTYDVKFTPIERGPHFLNIKYDGEDIQGSPFPLHVRDSAHATCGKNCEVLDLPQTMKTTKPRHFFVQMKDGDNNPVKSGGDPIKVVLKTPDGKHVQNLKVTDPNTGKYKVDLDPKRPGIYKVHCSLGDEDDGGEAISESPYTLNVKPGLLPINTELGDWEIEIQSGQDNEPEDFFFKFKSPTGKSYYPTISKLPKPEKAQSEEQDEFSNGDKFKVSFQPAEIEGGNYLIYANLCGFPVQGSPFKQTFDVKVNK